MKRFLLNSIDRDRDAVIWNMVGSMLFAFQSVIILMILTRTAGLVASGIFTIAFANANLFLNIGKYGMRNYQVSDLKGEISFQTYKKSRLITTMAMLVVSVVYTLVVTEKNGYTSDKMWCLVWMCILKLPDSIDDVYHGELQKQGRLDIASKMFALRMILSLGCFAFALIATNNLLWTIIISTFFTTGVMMLFLEWTRHFYAVSEKKNDFCEVKALLVNCFPIFLSMFLSFYVGNAPKYAIDAQLSDHAQACYGFLSMPVFVIGLLNGFIFNPMMYRISLLWSENKRNEFFSIIFKQLFVVTGITLVCVIGAYLLGVPVLSLLYNTDLSAYRSELIILLIGGGFLGASGVLQSMITIMRLQKTMLVGYVGVAVLALMFSDCVVAKYELMGAAVWYMLLMFALCIFFIVGVWIGDKQRIKEEEGKC